MKKKFLNSYGFTVLESLIVMFLFVIVLVVISQIYLSLVDAMVKAQNLQLALDNIRFGSEKIWNELKLGSNFNLITNSRIDFKDRNCRPIQLFLSSTNIVYFNSSTNENSIVFDENWVKVVDFKIYKTNTSSGSEIDNLKNTPKIFQINYDFILKTPRGDFPLKFRQTVAPLNSTWKINPCSE